VRVTLRLPTRPSALASASYSGPSNVQPEVTELGGVLVQRR
jgi:hypothetical protein